MNLDKVVLFSKRLLAFAFLIILNLNMLVGLGMGFDSGFSWSVVLLFLVWFSIGIPPLWLCWMPLERLKNKSVRLKYWTYYVAGVLILCMLLLNVVPSIIELYEYINKLM